MKGGVALAEVVLVEDEVLRELVLVAEHEPADAGVDEAELVPRDVDRLHRLEPEVPDEVGVGEGEDEASRGRVDVKRHVEAGLALAGEHRVDSGDVVALARERRAGDGDDADRVLVDPRLELVGADGRLALRQRDLARLDVEVAAELVPDHVHVAAEDQVRLVGRLRLRLTALLPLPLQGERPEHDRLRGALGAGARRLAGRDEEVGEHADAALLDLGRDRVLGVVDEVPVEVVGDDPLRLRLHPGGDEGRQVALRVALQCQFLRHEAHRVECRHAARREVVGGGVFGEEAIAVELGGLCAAEWLVHTDSSRLAGDRLAYSGCRRVFSTLASLRLRRLSSSSCSGVRL